MTVTASSISTPLEQLANRTAVLVPDVQVYTSSDTWTKPALALYIEIVAVGPGGDGGDGGGDGASGPGNAGGGGGGGGAGAITRVQFPAAAVPSTLEVAMTAGATEVKSTSNFTVYSPAGDDGADAHAIDGTAGAGGTGNDVTDPVDGGAGAVGTATGGAPASTGGEYNLRKGGGWRGASQTGGTDQTGAPGGNAGKGYGAGGGGGGGGGSTASWDAGGGGGGAAGYGSQAVAVDGTVGGNGVAGTNMGMGGAGGAGAGGLVVITTWRGAAVI